MLFPQGPISKCSSRRNSISIHLPKSWNTPRRLSITNSLQHLRKWHSIWWHDWLWSQSVCRWHWHLVHRFGHCKYRIQNPELLISNGELVQEVESQAVTLQNQCPFVHKMLQSPSKQTNWCFSMSNWHMLMKQISLVSNLIPASLGNHK